MVNRLELTTLHGEHVDGGFAVLIKQGCDLGKSLRQLGTRGRCDQRQQRRIVLHRFIEEQRKLARVFVQNSAFLIRDNASDQKEEGDRTRGHDEQYRQRESAETEK